ncbi:hypothetical protein [Phenylobacterium sp.]|uniref:hypothetical protein n=1 Tax=Phenylobacterium sp. TaxID=1871053 RepID=UPI0025DD0C8D|nr:hypothetical protein [Phenylobacterium sp.]
MPFRFRSAALAALAAGMSLVADRALADPMLWSVKLAGRARALEGSLASQGSAFDP